MATTAKIMLSESIESSSQHYSTYGQIKAYVRTISVLMFCIGLAIAYWALPNGANSFVLEGINFSAFVQVGESLLKVWVSLLVTLVTFAMVFFLWAE